MHPTMNHGYDTVRQQDVHPDPIELEYFEEAFTSQRWMMRIYKLKDSPNRASKKKTSYELKKAEKP